MALKALWLGGYYLSKLDIDSFYKVINNEDKRIFHVKVMSELPFWNYGEDTYLCLILTPGEYFEQNLIMCFENWEVMELTLVEAVLL
jgi:hypothetical protein